MVTTRHLIQRGGYNLLPVIQEVKRVVSDLAAGRITFILPAQQKNSWRYAPSFILNQKPSGIDNPAPYTARALAEHLGITRRNGKAPNRRRAGLVVEAALHVCELEEIQGWDEGVVRHACGGSLTLREILELTALSDIKGAREEAAAMRLMETSQ